ncbi:class I SAM-dependent methyltransferase [Paenibacillus tarimensis]
MAKLRNTQEEAQRIINLIELKENDIVVEFGSGTGEFSLMASKYCKKVYAIDISKTMLNYAERKAVQEDRRNIEYIQAGFLTYDHAGEPVNCIVTQLALHHLPDFWKVVVLSGMYRMLKPGGKLFISDIVFSFEPHNHTTYINNWIDEITRITGESFRKELILHIKDEYSTFSWLMEEMLRRAGFEIEIVKYPNNFHGVYVCSKPTC